MSDTAKILKGTKAKLHSAAQWTQGSYARNEAGNPTFRMESTATCWCLQGAIDSVAQAVIGQHYSADTERLVSDAIYKHRPMFTGGIIDFNDDSETKFSDIQAVLDLAIAKAEDEG